MNNQQIMFCSRCREQLQPGANFCPRCAMPVNQQPPVNFSAQANPIPTKKVGILLGIGILFVPYIFSWFTLQKGYSSLAKIVSFGWLGVVLLMFVSTSRNAAPKDTTTLSSSTITSWHIVKEFSGKSDNETESFDIKGSEWRVSWDNKGKRNFAILVMGEGSASAVTANVIGPDNGSSFKHGAGYYHLKIIASGPYTIKVEDQY